MTRRRRLRFTRGLAVAGRQLSPRPSDASPTARRLPRTAAPVTGRLRSPAVPPGTAPASNGQAVNLAPSAPGGHEAVIATGPERRALSGLAPPASTVLRIPLRGTRLRRAVDPGDLGQPSGPDGEGQARGQARTARGEPQRISWVRKTSTVMAATTATPTCGSCMYSSATPPAMINRSRALVLRACLKTRQRSAEAGALVCAGAAGGLIVSRSAGDYSGPAGWVQGAWRPSRSRRASSRCRPAGAPHFLDGYLDT